MLSNAELVNQVKSLSLIKPFSNQIRIAESAMFLVSSETHATNRIIGFHQKDNNYEDRTTLTHL